jgi:hypothetical protein
MNLSLTLENLTKWYNFFFSSFFLYRNVIYCNKGRHVAVKLFLFLIFNVIFLSRVGGLSRDVIFLFKLVLNVCLYSWFFVVNLP